MKARTVAVTAVVLAAALVALAATAVAKNIKLTGVVKSVRAKPTGFACRLKNVALLKGKTHVGVFTFDHCDSPGTTSQYRGTGNLTVGKITGKVLVNFSCSAQPIFGAGTVRKSNKSKASESFNVGTCLPITVGAHFKVVLTT